MSPLRVISYSALCTVIIGCSGKPMPAFRVTELSTPIYNADSQPKTVAIQGLPKARTRIVGPQPMPISFGPSLMNAGAAAPSTKQTAAVPAAKTETPAAVQTAHPVQNDTAAPAAVHNIVLPATKVTTVKAIETKQTKSVANVRSQKVKPGYYIQVSAETDGPSAKSKVSQLLGSDHQAIIQRAVIDSKKYHRVLVGPFKDKEAANSDIPRVMQTGVPQGTPFIRHEL